MSDLKFLPANAPGRPGKTILDALANLRLNADIENTGFKGEFSSSDEESDFRNVFYAENKNVRFSESSSSDEDKEINKPEPWNEVIPHPKKAKIVERKIKAPPKYTNPQIQGLKREVKERTESDPTEAVLSLLREWLTKESIDVLYSEEFSTPAAQIKSSEYGKKASAFLAEQPEEMSQEEDEEEEVRRNCCFHLKDIYAQFNGSVLIPPCRSQLLHCRWWTRYLSAITAYAC